MRKRFVGKILGKMKVAQGCGVVKRTWVNMEAISEQENCWTGSVGFTYLVLGQWKDFQMRF